MARTFGITLDEAKERAQRGDVYLQEFIPGLVAKNCHVNAAERGKVDNALRALDKKYMVRGNVTSLLPRATCRNRSLPPAVMMAYQQQMMATFMNNSNPHAYAQSMPATINMILPGAILGNYVQGDNVQGENVNTKTTGGGNGKRLTDKDMDHLEKAVASGVERGVAKAAPGIAEFAGRSAAKHSALRGTPRSARAAAGQVSDLNSVHRYILDFGSKSSCIEKPVHGNGESNLTCSIQILLFSLRNYSNLTQRFWLEHKALHYNLLFNTIYFQ